MAWIWPAASRATRRPVVGERRRAALADEAGRPRGSPSCRCPDPKEAGALEARIKSSAGAVLGVEAGDWDHEQQRSKHRPLRQKSRFGADPPAGLVTLHERGFDRGGRGGAAWSGCSLPRTDGAGRREAYRQALHSALMAPLGKLVGSELTDQVGGGRFASTGRS